MSRVMKHLAALALLAVGCLASGTAPAAATASHPRAIPPHGRFSGKQVPGLTGAALGRVIPAAASQHFFDLNKTHHGYPVTGAVSKTPDLSGWSGVQQTIFWGISPASGLTLHGASAYHLLNTQNQLSAADPDYVYGDTLDPSAIDCIEMTTYQHGTTLGVAAYNWCSDPKGFGKITVADSTFISTYTSPSFANPYAYDVMDMQTDPVTNTWTSYLYNFKTQAWDTFYTSADASKLSSSGGGWDVFEIWAAYNSATQEAYYCSETRGDTWGTLGLQYQTTAGGPWTAASTSNSSFGSPFPGPGAGGCDNPNLSITENSANGYWVTNPS